MSTSFLFLEHSFGNRRIRLEPYSTRVHPFRTLGDLADRYFVPAVVQARDHFKEIY